MKGGTGWAKGTGYKDKATTKRAGFITSFALTTTFRLHLRRISRRGVTGDAPTRLAVFTLLVFPARCLEDEVRECGAALRKSVIIMNVRLRLL